MKKSPILLKLKKYERLTSLEEFLCNEVALNLHQGLNPGLEPHAGPSHGVPVEAAHHLLVLLDQGVQSVMRNLINM